MGATDAMAEHRDNGDADGKADNMEFLGHGSLLNLAVRMNDVDAAVEDVDNSTARRRRQIGATRSPARSPGRSGRPSVKGGAASRASLNTSLILENLQSLQSEMESGNSKDDQIASSAAEYPLHTVHEDGSPRATDGRPTLAKPGPPPSTPRNDRRFDFIKRESLYNLATCMGALEEDIDDITRKSILQQASMSMSRMWGSEFFDDDEALAELQQELDQAYLSDDSGDLMKGTSRKNSQDSKDESLEVVPEAAKTDESTERIKQLEKEIESLQGQLETTKSGVLSRQKQQDEERRRLEEDICTLQEQVDASKSEVESRQQQQDEERRKLEKDIEVLQNDLDVSRTELKGYQEQKDQEQQGLLEKTRMLEQQLEEAKRLAVEERQSLHEKSRLLEQELADIKKAAGEERSSITEKAQSLEQQLVDARMAADKERSNLADRAQSLEQQLADVKRSADEERSVLTEKAQSLEQQLLDAKKTADDELESMAETAKWLEKQLSEAKQADEKKVLSPVNADIERIRAQQQKQRQSFQESALRLRRTLSDDSVGSGDVTSEVNEALKKQLEETKTELEQLRSEQEKDRQHLANSSKTQADAFQRVNEENGSLKRRLEELQARIQGEGRHEGESDYRDRVVIEEKSGDYKLLLLQQENEKLRKRLEKEKEVELDRLQSPSKVEKFRQSISLAFGIGGEESPCEEVEALSRGLGAVSIPDTKVVPVQTEKGLLRQLRGKRRNRFIALMIAVGILLLLLLVSIARHVSGHGSVTTGTSPHSSSFVTMDDMAARVSPLNAKIGKLQSEKSSLQGKLKTNELSLVELEKQLKDAKQESVKSRKEQVALTDNVDRLKSEKLLVEEKLQQAERNFDAKLKKLEQDTTKKIQTLEADKNAIQSKLKDVQKQLKDSKLREKPHGDQKTRLGSQRPGNHSSRSGPQSLKKGPPESIKRIRLAAKAGVASVSSFGSRTGNLTAESVGKALGATNNAIQATSNGISNLGAKASAGTIESSRKVLAATSGAIHSTSTGVKNLGIRTSTGVQQSSRRILAATNGVIHSTGTGVKKLGVRTSTGVKESSRKALAATNSAMHSAGTSAKNLGVRTSNGVKESFQKVFAATNGAIRSSSTFVGSQGAKAGASLKNQGDRTKVFTRGIVEKALLVLKGGTRRYVHSEQEAWLHMSGQPRE